MKTPFDEWCEIISQAESAHGKDYQQVVSDLARQIVSQRSEISILNKQVNQMSARAIELAAAKKHIT